MDEQTLKKELKKNMLQDLYDMEEKVKSGEVQGMLIVACTKDSQIFKQAAHPMTGLGLAHFAVMKMEDQHRSIEHDNKFNLNDDFERWLNS